MKRRARTGRYVYDGQWDRLCVCGHRLGDHTAESPHTCLVVDTDAHCARFRPSRKRPVATPK